MKTKAATSLLKKQLLSEYELNTAKNYTTTSSDMTPTYWTVALAQTRNNQVIMKEEVKKALRSLKAGNSPGVDNVPAELLKH